MSIGTFTLIKNEAPWIAAHILRVLPFVDEMVFFDGNSTDGTLEIIEAIKEDHYYDGKIRLFKDKDPLDLKDDYVRLFNECLRSLSTDLAWFLHPDMWVANPERISQIANSDIVAASVAMRSFGGNPGVDLFEISGRSSAWKSIFRRKNPDLGAHYFGHYGAWNEDVYFSEITGDKHVMCESFDQYPYPVADSGIEVLHFSDVRTYERRLQRMRVCLANQGNDVSKAESHPRVTLKPGNYRMESFALSLAEYPAEFLAARSKYKHLERSSNLVKA